MAERDMNQQSVTLAKVRRNHQKYKTQMERLQSQQSVTLAKVRRNHQKYKTQMEQPKLKWNSDLLGA